MVQLELDMESIHSNHSVRLVPNRERSMSRLYIVTLFM